MEELDMNQQRKLQLEQARDHSECLMFPVLNDFQIIDDESDPHNILLARTADRSFMLQVVTDGCLREGETFEQRTHLIVHNTLAFMKNTPSFDQTSDIFYLKDLDTAEGFNFKIYVQDMIVDNNGEKLALRQFSGFFLEPRHNDIYQVSLSFGPVSYPTNIYTIGKFDIVNDNVSATILGMLEVILNNIKYRY